MTFKEQIQYAQEKFNTHPTFRKVCYVAAVIDTAIMAGAAYLVACWAF